MMSSCFEKPLPAPWSSVRMHTTEMIVWGRVLKKIFGPKKDEITEN